MERQIHKTRLIAVFLFFLTLEAILLFRTAYLQIARSISFSKIAASQHKVMIELEPRRGAIYDRNMYKLAFNISVDSVFAVPKEIEPKEKPIIAKKLASILDLDYGIVAERLQRKKGFVWIKRKVSEEESQKIGIAKLRGVELIKESKRLYPNAYLAAHIIGFAGLDNTGLEGIELSCDSYLKGKAGFRLTARDAKRRFLAAEDEKFLAPLDGFNIILNIDETIQAIAEQALDNAYRKYNAQGATIIIMDPHNGEILALANRPTYDINSFSDSQAEAHRDRAVTDYFEPGSVFKIIAASALLEEGRVSFQDRFFCENGQYWIGGRVLHDHRPHGVLTFQEVIEQSSNIGTVKAAQKLSKQEMYDFVRAFGFGQRTGIDLAGEVEGVIRPPVQWSGTTMSSLPIGQEVTSTALQLACAMSVIANGGVLVRPWVIKEIRDSNGETIAAFSPQVTRRVISEETARKMRKLLKGVVEKGTGTLAKLDSYTAAGKTGTAQKVEPTGVYSHSRFVASFIGFAPADDPKITVVVCADEPHPLYFGGVVSAPVFKKVAEDTLRYMGVAQDANKKIPVKLVLDVKARQD